MLDIFLPPVLLVIVLVMIHAWFGRGVLQRGIIFTDLAIAQFSALGASLSLGYFHGEYLYLLSFCFSLLSALLIAFASYRKLHLEAFIGILYVLGASGIMMVLSESSEGMEHFKALLAADILFTPLEEIVQGMVVYASLALVIWKIYPRVNGFLKELLFFSMLAVTVTSSVHLAGVLVVFTLLVAPALLASMQKQFSEIYFAYIYGWGFSLFAIFISYTYDLPTGYSIVFVGALSTLIGVLFLSTKKQK